MTFPGVEYGYNGAVLIGYHLNQQGDVEDARILGEVPQNSPFSRTVLRQIKKWQADVNGVPDICRRDRTTVIQFTTVL
jgi:TonB family protein